MKIETFASMDKQQALCAEADYITQFLPGACHEHFLGDVGPADYLLPRNLVCLTLFNEPLVRFTDSLHSLIQGLSDAALADDSVITVVIDGGGRADPAVLDWLELAGCLDKGQMPDEDECAFFFASRRVDELPFSSAQTQIAPAQRFRFIIAMKGSNQGKLHSHALFFGKLCPRLTPQYCHQLDTGTVIAGDAIARLVGHMDQRPELGALAPRIATPPPHDGSLLKIWQYWDFVISRAFLWPAEIASGHLSVIPGQYCILRWRALRGSTEINDLDPHVGMGDAVIAHEPVAAYLRGLDADEPLDRIMYLAEDRVLGNEIVLHHRGAWRLGYDPRSVAITDACETLPELLRQRRRWTNSAMAARLALLHRSFALFFQADCSARERLNIALRSLWQINVGILEFAAPALFLCCFIGLLPDFSRALGVVPEPWLPALIGLALTTTLLILAPLGRLRSNYAALFRHGRDAGISALVMIYAVLLVLSDQQNRLWLLVVIVAATALTLLPFLGRSAARHLHTLPLYIVFGPFISLMILFYALCNMHDVSWGTKGLHQSPSRTRRSMKAMVRFRSIAVLLCLLLNIGAGTSGLLLNMPSDIEQELGISNLGLGIQLAELFLLLTIAAFFFYVQPRRSRPQLTIRTAMT